MALITRLSRLFRADLHAVLDRIEEPDTLLRHAVREMEEELAGDQQRAALMEHEHGQLVARSAEVGRSLESLEEELDVCFDSGKEDLARRTVRRRLEAERLLKMLDDKRETLERELEGLRGRIGENGSRLEAMRQKADLLTEERPGSRPGDAWSVPDVNVHDEIVEVAFLREQLKRKVS